MQSNEFSSNRFSVDNFKADIKWLCILVACLLCFFLIARSALYEGHNWGDDFGAYLQLAKNFNEGRDWLHNYSGIDVPPGFPILSALWMRLFGDSFIVLKMMNVMSWMGVSVVTYRLSRIFFNPVASLGAAVFILILPYYYYFQQNIGTDVPATFAGALAMFHLVRLNRSINFDVKSDAIWKDMLFASSWIFIALLFRPAALPLTVGGLGGFIATMTLMAIPLVRKLATNLDLTSARKISVKNQLYVLIILTTTTIVYFFLFGASSSDHINNASLEMSDLSGWAEQILRRSKTEFTNITTLLFGYGLNKSMITLTPFTLGLMALIYVRRTGDLILPCIAVANFMMLIVTPWENGPRYQFMMAVPIALISIATIVWLISLVRRKIKKTMPKFMAYALLAITAFFPLSGMVNSSLNGLAFNDEEIMRADAKAVLGWLIDNTDEKDRTCSFKPRAFMYLTDRPSCWLPPHNIPDDIGAYLAEFNAQYGVLTARPGYKNSQEAIVNLWKDDSVEVVFETLDYVIVARKDVSKRHAVIVRGSNREDLSDGVIIATGKRNKKSGNSEIWLIDVKHLGQGSLMRQGEADFEGDGFKKRAGAYVSYPQFVAQPTELALNLKKGRYILTFRKHPDSGIVKIKTGDETHILDLYSPEVTTVEFPLTVIPKSR